jgi:uncharacterized protein (TIGR02266 family)
MYLGVLMKRMWHFPIVASTAAEGRRISESNQIDLVLLDGSPPGRDVLSTVRLLRTAHLIGDIPLVVLLAGKNEPLSQSLLEEGCASVLTKPIDFSLAYGLLNRIMDQFRTTPRIPLKVRVRIGEGTNEKSVTSVDISEGGIYLRTLDPPPEGTVLHLAFSLPQDEEEIRLPAEVVRTFRMESSVENEPGMGLRFLEVPDPVRMKLRYYIQWEMMGDLDWETELETV